MLAVTVAVCFRDFKGDFLNISIFFAPSDSRCSNSCISAKYCPILTNHTSMESLFIQLSFDAYISISTNGHLRLVSWSRVTFEGLVSMYSYRIVASIVLILVRTWVTLYICKVMDVVFQTVMVVVLYVSFACFGHFALSEHRWCQQESFMLTWSHWTRFKG